MAEITTDTLRCAVYTRVSTQMQAEEEIPIEGQLDECQRYAQSKGWQIVKVYSDAGFTGGTIDRPAFQDMYAAAKSKPRPFDIILTWRSNRLFRDVEARLAYSRMFRSAGVRIASLHEPEYEGATGRLAETIFGAIDEYYRAQNSEDTLRGLKLIARRGYSTGGRPPTGYRNIRKPTGKIKGNGEPEMRTTWEPDPETSQKVLQAFQMYAEGRTHVEIIEATKIVANKSSLSTLLRNRAYLGERIYNTTRRASLQEKKYHRVKNKPDDFVMIQGTHDALVPEDLFYRVQAIIDKRRPNKTGRQQVRAQDYVLSGLLWCKEHNVTYVGQSNGSLAYYACGLRNRVGKAKASCPWMKKDAAESFVLDTLKGKIFTKSAVREGLEHLQAETAKARQEDDTELTATKAKIADVELKLSRLLQAVEGGVDLSAAQGRINERNQELQSLKVRQSELERQRERALRIPAVTDAAVEDVIGKLHTVLATTEPRELKAILAHFIEKIDVEGTGATFYYTFSGPKVENYASQWRPRGVQSDSHNSLSTTIPANVFTRGVVVR